MSQSVVADTVFNPSDVSALTLEMIEDRRNNRDAGVPISVPLVDDYFGMMRPGELITVLGRPSHFKSGLMQFIARSLAEKLRDRDDRCVIYVTWEQSIEEMTLMELAAMAGDDGNLLSRGDVRDYDMLVASAVQRSTLPLYLMGHSVKRRRRRPRLTMTDVENGLYYAEDEWGLRPALIVLDYLQRINPESGYDMRTSTSANVDRAKDLALAMGCPVVLGCQARREVDTRRVKLPTMSDGAESSNVEHSSDGMMSVWMPKVTESPLDCIPDALGLGNLPVTEDLLLLSVVKRKMGRAGKVFALSVMPWTNQIRAMVTRRIDL